MFYAVLPMSNAADQHDAFTVVFERFNVCFSHCLCPHVSQSITHQSSHRPEQICMLLMSDPVEGLHAIYSLC